MEKGAISFLAKRQIWQLSLKVVVSILYQSTALQCFSVCAVALMLT